VRKHPRIILVVSLFLTIMPVSALERVVNRPGDQGYLLPNGWTITPTGRQIDIPGLPPKVIVEPSGTHAFVLTSGWNDHGVSVVDLLHNRETQSIVLKSSWLGMQYDPGRSKLYVSGDTRAFVEVMTYNADDRETPLTLSDPITLDTLRVQKPYLAGIVLNAAGTTLYVADAHGQSLLKWI
jgi:DNA-binding beta-propeller fold protein YncE